MDKSNEKWFKDRACEIIRKDEITPDDASFLLYFLSKLKIKGTDGSDTEMQNRINAQWQVKTKNIMEGMI